MARALWRLSWALAIARAAASGGSTFGASGRLREGSLIGYSEVSREEQGGKVGRGCRDRDASCKSWAEAGECDRNTKFMAGACPASCGTCRERAHWKGCERQGCERVYLDVDIDGEGAGRITIDLFAGKLPRTCDNFKRLSEGVGAEGTDIVRGYTGGRWHRVIPGFMNQAGANRAGSAFGGHFDDEGFPYDHDEPYLVSMANGGPNTNGDQFFITVAAQPHLDHKHVVFGTVVAGVDLVERINSLGTAGGMPSAAMQIIGSGALDWVPLQPEDAGVQHG